MESWAAYTPCKPAAPRGGQQLAPVVPGLLHTGDPALLRSLDGRPVRAAWSTEIKLAQLGLGRRYGSSVQGPPITGRLAQVWMQAGDLP